MAAVRKSFTVAANASGTSSWTVVTNEASPTAVGDVVVVIHINDYYTLAAMSTPTATGTPTMNAITGATADGGGTNNPHIKAWWYVANTAGAQTVTFAETGTADEERAGVAVVFGGADTTNPVDAATSVGLQTSSTSQVAPSVSPTSSDAQVLAIIAPTYNSNAGYTPPGALTELYDGGVAGIWRFTVGGAQLASSGATGTYTFTATVAGVYVAATIAIKAATGSSNYSFPFRRNPSRGLIMRGRR